MDLRHIRYFVSLAEQLNFTRAAFASHVTQSTLSHQIRQLEDEIGQPLFQRSARKVELTPAGRAMLPGAIRALKEIDACIRAVKERGTMMVGELRVGVGVFTFGVAMMPDCAARFMASHSAVQLAIEELETDQIQHQLLARELEIGVTDKPVDLEGLMFEPIYDEELVLATGPDHPFAGRRRIRMIELHRQKIAVTGRTMITREIIADAFEEAATAPIIVAELKNVDALMQMARTSQVGAIVSRSSAERVPGLRIIGIDGPTPMRTLGLLRLADGGMSPLVRAFADVVHDVVQGVATAPGWPAIKACERMAAFA